MTTAQASDDTRKTWRASHAWICAVVLVVLSYGFNEVLWSISRTSPTSASWLGSPLATLALRAFRAAWWVLVVFLFTRPLSVRGFLRSSGLASPPSLFGWFAAWLGVTIGLFTLYCVTSGLIPQNQTSAHYYTAGGFIWWSYAASLVLLTAFYEETVTRGFLYRAFRGNYGIVPSTVCVLLFVGYFHWGLAAQPLSFVLLLVGAVFLCMIREWTGSVWNCILFHAAYNAAVTLRWPFYVFGLLAVLPLCARTVGWPRVISADLLPKHEV